MNLSGLNLTRANETINLTQPTNMTAAHEVFRDAYRQALFQSSFALSLFLLSFIIELSLIAGGIVVEMPDEWYEDKLPSLRQELWAFRLGLSIVLVAQMMLGGALI